MIVCFQSLFSLLYQCYVSPGAPENSGTQVISVGDRGIRCGVEGWGGRRFMGKAWDTDFSDSAEFHRGELVLVVE